MIVAMTRDVREENLPRRSRPNPGRRPGQAWYEKCRGTRFVTAVSKPVRK